MFTGALIKVLTNGTSGAGEHLSSQEVHDLLWEEIRATHSDAVRPQLHEPDQRLSRLPLFPNPLRRQSTDSRPSRMDDTIARNAGEIESLRKELHRTEDRISGLETLGSQLNALESRMENVVASVSTAPLQQREPSSDFEWQSLPSGVRSILVEKRSGSMNGIILFFISVALCGAVIGSRGLGP